ncbi:MAG: DUF6640 family protein [Bryobacteraceae bacterium]
MNRIAAARILLTLILLAGVVSSFVLDWSPNHLLNPAWHPHAKFHGALLLFFLTGSSSAAWWLLWRRSAEPVVAIRVAGAIAASFWAPLFFVPFVLPEASWWAGDTSHIPRYQGWAIYPNLLTAAVFLLATAAAVWLPATESRSWPVERDSQKPAKPVRGS